MAENKEIVTWKSLNSAHTPIVPVGPGSTGADAHPARRHSLHSQISSWTDAHTTPVHKTVLRNEDRLMYVMTDMIHPMVVNGMVFLAEPLSLDSLKGLCEHLVVEYPVCSSVVRDGVWNSTQIKDFQEHITMSEVRADQNMEDFVSNVVSSDLRMDIPMWHLHQCTQASTNQHVLVMRIHHCIGDGIALMTVLDKLLLREEPSADESALRRNRRKVPCYIKILQTLCLILLAPLVMLQLLFMRRDPETCFRCKTTSARKSVVWLNPMSLHEIKQVGKAVHGTVNDVCCSVTAGALSRYLEIVQGAPFRKDLKCIVPYSVRSWPERFDLNNRVGAIFINLPVAIKDPVKRMKVTKKRFDRLKSSAWVPVTLMLVRVTTRAVSAHICKWLQYVYASKCTLIFSNVKAATSESELMGMKVKHVMGFVPLPGHISLGITMVSYNDQIYLGIVANPDALKKPRMLADQFLIEFTAMKEGLGIASTPDEVHHRQTVGSDAVPMTLGIPAAPALAASDGEGHPMVMEEV